MKEYNIKLTTLAPLHIGEGKTIKKQEYIYDPRNETVTFIDGAKLTRFLKKKGLLSQYLKYLNDYSARADLKRFLFDHQIKSHEWKSFELYKERVFQGKKDGKHGPRSKDKPMNDINTFVRNGRGEIYVPGSSIKGALRTILLQSLQEDTPKNSMYQNIKISDSNPIKKENLSIYQKIDISKKENPMPLYRECIQPKVTIECRMIIDNGVIDIEEIKNALNKFYTNYNEKWLNGFINTDAGKEFFKHEALFKGIIKDNTNVIYLGGGSGLVSKSLYYQTETKETAKKEIYNLLRQRYRNIYGKMREIPDNVPVALKASVDLSKNEKYQQGLCMIEFEEVGG